MCISTIMTAMESPIGNMKLSSYIPITNLETCTFQNLIIDFGFLYHSISDVKGVLLEIVKATRCDFTKKGQVIFARDTR